MDLWKHFHVMERYVPILVFGDIFIGCEKQFYALSLHSMYEFLIPLWSGHIGKMTEKLASQEQYSTQVDIFISCSEWDSALHSFMEACYCKTINLIDPTKDNNSVFWEIQKATRKEVQITSQTGMYMMIPQTLTTSNSLIELIWLWLES